MQAHLARENAVRHSVSTAPRLCTHLHFGACPVGNRERSGGTKHTHFLLSFPPPLPNTLCTQVDTGSGVKEDGGEGNMEVPCARQFPGARGPALPPPPHSQAWLLPLPPRARFGAEPYIPAARRARPPPSFPFSPPPVEGPERAPAVNSPGTPLGAGGRARSPPPDPAPPHPAQAVASASAESPAPSCAARSLPLPARAVLPSPRPGLPPSKSPQPRPATDAPQALHCLFQCSSSSLTSLSEHKTPTRNCPYGATRASDEVALLSANSPPPGFLPCQLPQSAKGPSRL